MPARIFDRIIGAVIGALALALIAVLAGIVNAGPLDPPAGAPSSTLPQVEPRNPIPPVGWNGSFPITISERGSYFLTRNLTATTPPLPVIAITANDVHLDLNGFTVDGGAAASEVIRVSASFATVKNGVVRNAIGEGVLDDGGSGNTYRNLTLEDNGDGLSVGTGALVEDCLVRDNALNGIVVVAGTIGATIRACNISGVHTVGVMVTGSRALVEGNHIVVSGTGSKGIIVGNRSTIRGNTFVGESPGYVSIDVGASANSIVIENRFECGTETGDASDDFFPLDFSFPVTNVCELPSP